MSSLQVISSNISSSHPYLSPKTLLLFGSSLALTSAFYFNTKGGSSFPSSYGASSQSSSASSFQSSFGSNFPQQSGPVQAAIETHRTVEVRPVNIPSEPVQPQVIEVGSEDLPVTVHFKSQSSRVLIQQTHIPGIKGSS